MVRETNEGQGVEFRHSQVVARDSSVHVIEAGDPAAKPVVFLHGWPESWRSWQAVMELASRSVRAVAIDLPGVGGSSGAPTDGSKRQIARVVIADVVIPGVDPWAEVLRNPYLWHFAFHSIPGLPERLVTGHQAEYFDYFHGIISADPARITAGARASYVEAYSADTALTSGFNWYRTFPLDAEQNRQVSPAQMTTHLLYPSRRA